MISYKDKLLFLSFKKILTTYLQLVEAALNAESESILLYKNNIPTTLSISDKKYAHSVYDDMLFQNNKFKQLIQNINYEISIFHSSLDFSLSITSDDNINEFCITHLKNIEKLL